MKILSISKLLRDSLILSLALSLSGTLPVLHSIAFATELAPLQLTAKKGDELEDQMEVMVRRAKHPGTPGTPPGIPNASDVQALETAFTLWQEQLEHALTLPNVPTGVRIGPPGTPTYLPVQTKLQIISLYLNRLTLLTTLRIALHLTHGPSWSQAFALRVPKSVMTDFPGLGSTGTNRLNDRFTSVVIDRGIDNQADPVRLNISTSLVQGLELGALAVHPDEKSFLTMIQYLAIRQLIQTLTDLRYLKQDHHITVPEIPEPLRSKMETMGLASTIAEEQRRAVAEPGARAAIAQSYDAIASQVPAFVTDSFATELANIIGKTRKQRRKAKTPLMEALLEAETANLNTDLRREVFPSSLPLSAMSSKEMLATLRFFLSNAKANTVLHKLMAMLANETIGELDSTQRVRIMEQLDARKNAYSAAIEDALVRTWYDQARQVGEELLFTSQRNQFIESLLAVAPQALEKLNEAHTGDIIDPSILASTFAAEKAKMQPSPVVDTWLYEIAHAGTYAAARAKYFELMIAATASTVMSDGGEAASSCSADHEATISRSDYQVDGAKVLDYLAHHSFRPDLTYSKEVEPALAERLISRVGESRKLDVRNLLAIGSWFGFDRALSSLRPSVREVLPNEGKQEHYFQKLNEIAVTQNPLLAAEITTLDSKGAAEKTRLADALVAINPNSENSASIISRATPLIDQALIHAESKIREDIQKIATTTDVREIEKIVTSSMMLTLVMKGFPEFRLQQQDFIEEVLSPSFTNQIMHRYVGNYLGYGFGVIILVHATKWMAGKVLKRALPPLGAITAGVDTVLAGYMRSALVVMLADAAYQASELYKVRKDKKQVDDFFASGVTGRTFFDYSELQGADSTYLWAKWGFVGRMAMDIPLMYFPMARGLLTARGDRILLAELQADSKAFEILGLKPAQFDSLDSVMKAFRAARNSKDAARVVTTPLNTANMTRLGELMSDASSMSLHEVREIERAFTRLSGKVAAGQTYRLPNMLEQISKEDAFRRLSLNPGKAKSWEKIDEAFEKARHGATNPQELKALERARAHLKKLRQENPNIPHEEFEPASKAERKLIEALGRSPLVHALSEAQ